MNISPALSTMHLGSNSALNLNIGDQIVSISIVDELVFTSFKSTAQQGKIAFEVPKISKKLVFKAQNVKNLIFIPMDTYEKYSVHDVIVDLRKVDQIMFDPDLQEEDFNLTIVGFGWVLGIIADSLDFEFIEI